MDAVVTYKASELEENFQQRGVVFWLVFTPALIPAGIMLMYIMWIGFKIYIHSPEKYDDDNDDTDADTNGIDGNMVSLK